MRIVINCWGFLCTLFLLQNCNPKPASNHDGPSFTEKIATAHQKDAFKQQAAVAFDLVLTFGGKVRYNGRIVQATNDQYIRLSEDSNRVVIVRGDTVFYAPAMQNPESIRFSAYTWPYFFMLPYKLDDPGTIWSEYSDSTLNGTPYFAQKLSFKPGTGDAPDDWYVIYADTAAHRINTAAYIVTSDTRTQEQAEANPHAITYHDYKFIDGVPFATRWGFWEWRTDSGLTKKIGSATLENLMFLDDTTDLFTVPADFKMSL